MPTILVCGSRTWKLPDVVASYLEDLHELHGPALTVLHGACPDGADAHADAACIRMGIACERVHARWALHGKRAGILRNGIMLDRLRPGRGDFVIAFRADGTSPGTDHVIREAIDRGIPHVVVHEAGRIERWCPTLANLC